VLPWAITRAEPDASRVCDELRAAGVVAVAVPCIERVPCEVVPWRPSAHRVVVLTSAGTVEALGQRIIDAAPDEVAALAPATARAVERLGLKVTVESANGVVALAHAIAARLERRGVVAPAFWYPTSDAGLEQDEQREAVARLGLLGPVTRPVAYTTRAPPELKATLAGLRLPFGAFFASPSAVANFVAASPPRPERVVCWGASTLRAALPHFPRAELADRARPLEETLTQKEPHHV
jgi:uroporphyrinogen-III synthase